MALQVRTQNRFGVRKPQGWILDSPSLFGCFSLLLLLYLPSGEALVHPVRGPAQHTQSFPGPQAASVPFYSQLYICAVCGALTAVLGSRWPLGPHTRSLERCSAHRRVGIGRRPGWQLSPEAGAATWPPWALGVKRGRDLPGRVIGGLGGARGRGQGL